ncbi:MAG: pyruvate:ferredoxin (flavodoxin) oxidoreductase [Bacteroidales bacterium]|nr:pyruvate:ferredoxin (flavodoxin) oxidoreductase [Bacteroidales bacterium]
MMAKKFITCDGNQATANIAYMFSEVSAIYPITPSSNMAEHVDEWAANGRKNIFGEEVRVVEMQSEGGAAGAVHGSLQAGALTSTYTASQGLLLMIPNMYKMAGELLPAVFHVSARSVAAHALSIFGDHSDIYATRPTGFALLASGSVQEASDLAGVAHLAAIKTRIPFVHFFDGFRTSHEIQKIEVLEEGDYSKLIDYDALQEFRDNAINPEHPVTKGTAQNPDIYFQAKESVNKFYEPVADVVNDYMKEITKLLGREYKPFTYYGAPDAENIIIAMGSVAETIRETVDFLNAKGQKVGFLNVHLYRPFALKYFFDVMPKTVKRISVLDRTKEPGANGEPLYLDVVEAFYGKKEQPLIIGGRYGLSSKDTTPAQIISVFENLANKEPKNQFTLGIIDDVTFTSLPLLEEIDLAPAGTFQGKFFGLGSDGTVGANKNSIKIIGDNTDKYAQAYFAYDSKKSGGITISHLRFGDSPIRSTYLVNTPDFVACHVPAYLELYDVLKGIKKGGTFLLNSIWDKSEIEANLPNSIKKCLATKEISAYMINATEIAKEIGLGNRTNTILQSAFFKISNVIPYDLAVKEMKYAIEKSYGLKGEKIVKMNYAAVDRGGDVIKITVKPEWANLKVEVKHEDETRPEFVRKIADVVNRLEGDSIPVSAFVGREDGTLPAGTTEYEKRAVAVDVPNWNSETCIQCNACAYSCPHAVIRPFLLTDEEAANAPEGTTLLKAKGKGLEGYQYKIQISVEDCTGCGVCADVCPTTPKTLNMMPIATQMAEKERWEYMFKKVGHKTPVDPTKNILVSQFAQPLFEFSGACAGCGETPYVKLVTQLFGDHMTIANATGCSSIYGGSAPATPYTKNPQGQGPAWANSLFEDNAEYGFGMAVGTNRLRGRIADRMEKIIANGYSDEMKAAAKEWLDGMFSFEASKLASAKIIPLLEKTGDKMSKELLGLKDYFVKQSNWIFGGDGWAYDIGYGGLDHVLAMGENVNVLVMDTEVYSNTGGQSSKASPTASVAKFAAAGKPNRKKDLGLMATTYGYVYVAQVALGANPAHFFKVLKEAEAYNGPSLIIAYSPCIAHGIKGGMTKSQVHQKEAVKAGFWQLYKYDPTKESEGKNPFSLDSKEPDWSLFKDFLMSETRFSSLKISFPDRAEKLFQEAEEAAKWRYNSYRRLAEMDFSK